MKEIDWRKAPEWAVWHGMSDTGCGIKGFWLGQTEYQEVGDVKSYPYGGAGIDGAEHNHRFPEFQHVTTRPKHLPATTITTKMAILENALRSCVAVMERDLNGLALIQPELKEAKQALEDMYLVDAELEPWNGEGLPPAGAVCELRTKTGGWGEAEIKYQGRGICVWLWIRRDGNTDQVEWAENPERMEFRKLRTKEQIAAEERESELNRMVCTAKILDKTWARKVCADLYDAGYRKQVQP